MKKLTLAAVTIRAFICILLLGVAGTAGAFNPVPIYLDIREYTNDVTGHYVLLNDAREIAGVEAGAAGPGWRFTGYAFSVYTYDPDGRDVCRFYAPSSNSHFFTANADECASLKQPGTGWLFEGVAFRARVPVNGACNSSTTPVYRQYNNRAAFLDSNHRFDFDSRIRKRMAAQGWIDEGIAFCAFGAGRWAQFGVTDMGTAWDMSTSCDPAPLAIPVGCIEARGLPPLTTSVDRTFEVNPPYTPSPDWSPAYEAEVGWTWMFGRLSTFGALASQAVVLGRTFVIHGAPDQNIYSSLRDLGVHLSGADRVSGDYSSVSVVSNFYAQPSPGKGDFRAIPWAGRRDSDVIASFSAVLKYVRRPTQVDHGYGVVGIRLKDLTSGRRIQVNLLAFGTIAPGDFTGIDARTGDAIVSTTFAANSAFGQNRGASFVPCSPACDAAGRVDFNMTIGIEDARVIIERARSVDPALSPNPGDYLVERSECRAEAFRDAQLAGTLSACRLQVTY